jgi:adenine deaminase
MASSCVPASSFESPRRAFSPGDLEGLLRRRRVLGVAEMMNFPGVIAGDPAELAKLGLEGATHVDGHAPGVRGDALQEYAAAGIRSDHEARELEEGRERLRAGMFLLIREGSAARNLDALVPLLAEYGPGRIAFCTDDREPEHIADDGHLNGIVRRAVAAGVRPEDALVAASHSGARWHGLRDFGAVAPGYQADLLLLPDLERFEPELVLKRGRPFAPVERPEVPDWVRNTVRIGEVRGEALAVPAREGRVRVVGVIPGQIVTEALEEEPPVADGHVVADASRDLAKLAVFERHLGTGRVGVGLVRGFGLERGALASTIAHDAHNVVVVGTSDEDMRVAVERLAERGGGIVAVEGGEVRAELPLPIAGLISDETLETVIASSRACHEAARALGCRLDSPFQTMAFLGLSVIPHLKLTDRGLVDVDAFELVDLWL